MKTHHNLIRVCRTGFSLALANMTYLKYRVEQMSNSFTNAQTGEKLNAIILDSNNEIISLGQEKDMSSFTLVNLLAGLMAIYLSTYGFRLGKVYRRVFIEPTHR